MESKPVLNFNFDINHHAEEINWKGYCADVLVTLPNNLKYKACFYDPVRLQQDLVDEHYIAVPGLIIIQDVTIEKMNESVDGLYQTGYFDKLKPI